MDDLSERAALGELAMRLERSKQQGHEPDPWANEVLVPHGSWFAVHAADGRPLLQAVVLVQSDWALLRNFRTPETSPDSSLARFWMTSVLARELTGTGVAHLIDDTHPVRVSNGVRYFQRTSGYTFRRID